MCGVVGSIAIDPVQPSVCGTASNLLGHRGTALDTGAGYGLKVPPHAASFVALRSRRSASRFPGRAVVRGPDRGPDERSCRKPANAEFDPTPAGRSERARAANAPTADARREEGSRAHWQPGNDQRPAVRAAHREDPVPRLPARFVWLAGVCPLDRAMGRAAGARIFRASCSASAPM